jgi:hypothetical protein
VKDRNQEVGVMLGSRSILAKVALAPGMFGLILAMDTHPAANQVEKTDEVLQLLCDAVDDWDFVETGVMPDLTDPVSLAALAIEPNPRDYTFESVIPLRHADRRGNYMVWNHNTHNWDIRPFNPRYVVTGERIMLLVKEKVAA